MILFLKSASFRRVFNKEDCNNNNNNIINNSINSNDYKEYDYYNKGLNNEKKDGPWRILTVWRKSLLVNCSGFTVIDSKGNLLYRVDNYSPRPLEIVLMDAFGKSLFTVRRHKTLRLVDDWVIYEGETNDEKTKIRRIKRPVGYMKKNVSLLQTHPNIVANVFLGKSCKTPTYVIEGSYGQRSCKVVDKSSKTIVAEIKRKEAMNGGVSFGLDVFMLVVSPGFDTGFAMTLVLLLDQMYS